MYFTELARLAPGHKKLHIKICVARRQTGGGSQPAPLSALKETLMEFMGYEAAEGLALADTMEVAIKELY